MPRRVSAMRVPPGVRASPSSSQGFTSIGYHATPRRAYALCVRVARLLSCFASVVALVGACGAPLDSTPEPTLVDPPTRMLVAVGVQYACAARVGGQVSCWGHGWQGKAAERPAVVAGVDDVAELVASVGEWNWSSAHACARTHTGSVYRWGRNDCGQSDPDDLTVGIPARVAGVDGARRIAAGDGRSCALLGDGHVVCWGDRCAGGPAQRDAARPVAVVAGVEDAIELSRGSDDHFCAIRADGSVVCWGENYWGQLGAGDRAPHAAPVVVAGVANAVRVVVSDSHSSALLADGTVMCWGSCASRLTPVPVVVPNMAHTVDLGTGVPLANCIRRPDGSVQCACLTWAPSCDFGFEVVLPLEKVTSLSTAMSNACAAQSDDSVLCWGIGANGELGDGKKHLDSGPNGEYLVVGPTVVPLSL